MGIDFIHVVRKITIYLLFSNKKINCSLLHSTNKKSCEQEITDYPDRDIKLQKSQESSELL